ncbi:EAL domain-containing protein [Burkholderiaceae bacterium DAT-1]|nr:EAL domain-containing protein [Burkholderiaceae bacterium DAT-1]
MELFAPDEVVRLLESRLGELDGRARLEALLELAWHKRQRDSHRTQLLLEEIEIRLRPVHLPVVDRMRIEARIRLIRAEFESLAGHQTSAMELAESAIATFEQISDAAGAGDGRWLLASIWSDLGKRQQVNQSLNGALRDYRLTTDQNRIDAAMARILSRIAFVDAEGAAHGLAESFPAQSQHADGVNVWISIAQANVAALTDDPGEAIKFDLNAYNAANVTGQIAQALVCAVNIAEGFATLGDLHGALDWAERALRQARESGWPGSIGLCLVQAGDILRLLGREGDAQHLLNEALAMLDPMTGSRTYELLLEHLGQLALDGKRYSEALDWFVQLESSLSSHGESDLLIKSWRGQATALVHLGRPADALAKVAGALGLARSKGNSDEQVKALRVFAELHQEYQLAGPDNLEAPTPALHYLGEALTIARSIGGYRVPTELYNQLADAWAGCGDYQRAYQSMVEAAGARNQSRVEEAQKRAVAMQLRHEVDQVRADAEHHKRLASALQETNATLEALGRIGREITANLLTDDIMWALSDHARTFLDATSLLLFLVDEPRGLLRMAFALEGKDIPPDIDVKLDDPVSLAAKCVRERKEIVVGATKGPLEFPVRAGTLMPQSMIFEPLEVGRRLIGVISIQSTRENAYGDRECSIFRTLCAYAAIALDNAFVYREVEVAREALAAQEQELKVVATAFESQEGLMIASADLVVLRVNTAFTRITGYPADAVLGHSPSILQSARHGDGDFDALIGAVRLHGSWQGEIWAQRVDQTDIPLWLSVTAVRNELNVLTHIVFALVDITERKRAEDEIRNLAFFDPLTNLPNRRLLMDRLRLALARSARSDQCGALLFIDLDNFKRLNDTRGHGVGDMLLSKVAKRLVGCVRAGDTVARLGGDEFVVLLEGLPHQDVDAAEKVEVVAQKIHETLNTPYLLDNIEHRSTPSIGICLFTGKDETVDELLKQADLAMYQAKGSGRNAIRFFDPAMQAAVSAHAALEEDMREGLALQQFVLHYQIQVDSQGRVQGAEALVRWKHPQRGMVSPAQFIPLAEETALILPLGLWVLETACQQLQQWEQQPDAAHLTLAVNISAVQFHHERFIQDVLGVLKRYPTVASRLKLELTESLLFKDVDAIIDKMNTLIPLGVRFSLDDFGTGYSSLSYLKRLPLEQLKIDQTFVRDIMEDASDLAIVKAIVTLGQILGLAVIAEGVETPAQKALLQESGCFVFQGYLFGRPGPVETLTLGGVSV